MTEGDTIRTRLRRLMDDQGYSENELSRRSGVPQPTINRILSGESRSPRGSNVDKISKALGVAPSFLTHGVSAPAIGDSINSGPRVGDLVREGKMGDYPKAPPKDDFEWAEPKIVEDEGPLRPDEVELPFYREVEMAAGDGRTQVVENHGASMRFSLAKLSRAGVQPHLAACATASGTSMEPTILDGSPIGIDKGARHVVDGKIYALDHGGMLRIKRLYKLPLGRVRLVSDNADEYPEEVCGLMGPDAPKIIGRVFWWENFD
ncbi:Peptidase S24-like [Halomonas shengliensis]|uniref:Peptidase S24-like n=1 Tax=Halomonas shengliensis TaxID=419597 RepID=A0A1H0ICF2_9GAMM|nr:Peptidase S24-like [Halomonas shengliensis]